MKPTVVIIDEVSGMEILRERREDVVERCVSDILNNRVSELLMLGGMLGLEADRSVKTS
jgi:hypothetical protein